MSGMEELEEGREEDVSTLHAESQSKDNGDHDDDDDDNEDDDGGEEPATSSSAKKRGRKKSWVHRFGEVRGSKIVCMVEHQVDVNGSKVVAQCQKEFSYLSKGGSAVTTAFKNHLVRDHGFNKDGNIKQRKIERGLEGGLFLNGSLPMWTVADPRAKALTEDIAKMIAIDGRPAHDVAKPGFKAFVKKRFAQWPGTTPPTIASRHKEFCESFFQWFKAYSKTVEWWAGTTDGWTSDANEKYRTFTFHHFIPNTTTLASFVLRTRRCGGSELQIGEFLSGCIRDFELLSIRNVAVTVDHNNAEGAGLRVAGLVKNLCGDHFLNLVAKEFVAEAKGPTSRKPARIASPVLAQVTKLLAFGTKLRNAPNLMDCFIAEALEYARTFQLPPLVLPTVPPKHRWNYLDTALQTSVPARAVIDAVIVKKGAEYGLDAFTAEDWKILEELHDLTGPLAKLATFLEGESYVTIGDFLGKILDTTFPMFYMNRGQDGDLDWRVRAMKERLRDVIGTRLWAMANDVSMSALALHPFYRKIAPPGAGFSDQWYLENKGKNIATFFFKDLRSRLSTAVLSLAKRLQITVTEPPPNLVLAADDPRRMYVSGLRHASAGVRKPQEELDHWLNGQTYLVNSPNLAQWWDEHGRDWPFLRRVAAAVFVVPASSSPSERIWSAADDLSGNDRASIDETTLDIRLVLKKNIPVQAQIMGKDLFDVLGMK